MTGAKQRDAQYIGEHAHLCSPLPFLSLSGVDRHDCFFPCFSVLCELWVELVLSLIAPHSVHPPQFGPSSTSLPSHLHRCYLLCTIRVFSSHCMTIPRKAFYVVIGSTIASVLNLLFSLTGTFLSQITPDNAIQEFHADHTLLSTSAPHPPVAYIVEPKYLNELVHGIGTPAKQNASLVSILSSMVQHNCSVKASFHSDCIAIRTIFSNTECDHEVAEPAESLLN